MTVRVLFVNDTARNGGPGRTLHAILKFLDPARVHRAVVVPRRGVVSQLLEGACEELALEPRIVENPFAPWTREMVRADFDAPGWTKARRALGNVGLGTSGVLRLAARARGYDVVFCNGTTANFFGGILARLFGVRVVWHVFYTAIDPPLTALHRFLAASPRVGAILCVSKPTTVQFDGLGPKVVHLRDAIDADEYAPGETGVLRGELDITKDTVVIGSLGRILRRKGFLELVRVAKLVFDRLGPRDRVRFVVLGDTPEDSPVDHLAECRALVKELGLEGKVHFLGFRPDVRSYVSDFDAVMIPSVYPDPLPRSVLESMSMAKPVLAFDVGGIGEMVESGTSGMLAPGDPPDLEAMASACLAYVRDPETRRRHGQAARQRILHDYGARAHAKAIEEIILRVARGDPPR